MSGIELLERLQHNFIMYINGKENVLKFLLKHFNA